MVHYLNNDEPTEGRRLRPPETPLGGIKRRPLLVLVKGMKQYS